MQLRPAANGRSVGRPLVRFLLFSFSERWRPCSSLGGENFEKFMKDFSLETCPERCLEIWNTGR